MLTNTAATEEWLYDDDNITHENPYEDDVLDVSIKAHYI